MNMLCLCLFFLGVSAAASAQKYVLRGMVIDSAARPLPSATVMLLQRSDSSLVAFQVSGAQGGFEMKNVARGNYFVKVTYTGLVPLSRAVRLPEQPSEVDLGRFQMVTLTTQLEGVVVRGEINPVTVKRDTIEYNVTAFKTKTNATVEDLLKKMPGIDVETDGTVKAQGEQVRRVMVDGREFFGRDPKIATRNLPADAINKVQVFDKKSDQAVFSGIDDGQREKTINLELKEEKRKGAFGTLMAGAGTDSRWQGRLSLNRFRKNEQLSVLGMGNNINEQGFSFEDYFNFSGASSQLAGGRAGGGGAVNINVGGDAAGGIPLNTGGRQNGIVTNVAGGVNFNKDLSKKTTLTSSYFYNQLDQTVSTALSRINYLPGGLDYTFRQNSRQQSTNDSHRAHWALEHKIDSANSLKWSTSVTYAASRSRFASTSETYGVNAQLQNTSTRSTRSDGTSGNVTSALLYRHRFAKKGRTFSANVGLTLSQTESRGTLSSENEFFSGPTAEQSILQENTQDNTNQSYSATLSYTEPLGGRKYLEVNYAIRTNQNEVDRPVWDVGNGGRSLVDSLSNRFDSDYLYQRPGLNLRINRAKYNLAIGAGYQITSLQGNVEPQNARIDRTFQNLLPSARFNYDFSSTRHLRVDYETSVQEPTIQQLQPVINNTDPLNISLGNPVLKPAYVHTGSLNYTSFDQARLVSLFAFFSAVYMKDAITNA
nr:outer membrane beta-barrel protein [Cyclobacteriaceae bacterium]